MRAFVLCSLALLVLITIPFTGLLGFWAMMAESGGKNSHPEVVPIMLWGIAELIWTLVASARYRHMPLPSVRLLQRLLAVGSGAYAIRLACDHGRCHSIERPG